MANLPSNQRREPAPALHRWIIKGDLAMTRITGAALIAAIVLLAAPSISLAQNKAGAPSQETNEDTNKAANSTGAAQSSPAPNRQPGVTTGSAAMGSGNAASNSQSSIDATINQENNAIDRKLKGICRGC
jgi:hypothetical protein